MRHYSQNEIEIALKKVGLKKNQIIYINPEIYKFGLFKGAKNKNQYFKIFFDKINKILGKKGTIVINSYTFQTLRHNKKFIHEKTVSSSGKFSEYIRNKKGSIRSNHPVFSVAARGKYKANICNNNSLNNYGYKSPYHNFLKLKGQILNLGMDPWLNPFLHVAEFITGVPYCYNKLTKVSYLKNKKRINKSFSSFVRYKNLNLIKDYAKLKKKLTLKKIVKSFPLGSGNIYMYDANKYVNLALELLSEDQFILFKKIPKFTKGQLPLA